MRILSAPPIRATTVRMALPMLLASCSGRNRPTIPRGSHRRLRADTFWPNSSNSWPPPCPKRMMRSVASPTGSARNSRSGDLMACRRPESCRSSPRGPVLAATGARLGGWQSRARRIPRPLGGRNSPALPELLVGRCRRRENSTGGVTCRHPSSSRLPTLQLLSPRATRTARAAEATSTASTSFVPRSRPSERRPCRFP